MLKWVKWILKSREIAAFMVELVEVLEDREITRDELDQLLLKARDILVSLDVKS